ncbi:1,4-dihydroxy-2-naphthoate octaprenyltransferase [Halobacteriales archaeon SW_7_68_16]|nr:MAG: 1,4-dihydroxy-2-naphthoate octaprenyltransferase [Halobacteriales archaeon SW_7_68_16]
MSLVDHPPRRIAWALYAMSRPSQLLLIAVVYGTGVAAGVARLGGFEPIDTILGLFALLPVATSVHYANEYADFVPDALATRTPFSGGSGALVRTGLPRRLAGYAAGVTGFVGAVGVTVCLSRGHVGATGAGVLVIIAILGWGYSLPPPALARRGLGEIDNAVLGGLALPLYGHVAVTGRLGPDAVVAFLPLTGLVFLNLLATTWPDRAVDGAAGKATLATRLDPKRLRVIYAGGVVGTVVALAGGWVVGAVPVPVVVGTLPAAPFVGWGWITYTRRASPFPAVAAMVVAVVGQLAGWLVVAGVA